MKDTRKLELEHENNASVNQFTKLKGDLRENLPKMTNEGRGGASRVLGNLPTIQEQQVDDETIDVLSALER